MPASEKRAGEQDQRRAIGDADLAGDEGKAPEQAEQADFERQPIEAAAAAGTATEGASDIGSLLGP